MNVFAAVVGFVFAFVMMTVISFNLEGEGGIAATHLTANTTDDATSITVLSTQGFLDADALFIGGEVVCYTSITATTFDGLTRGCRDTSAEDHNVNDRVYNEASGALNSVVGFNIAETMATAGALRVIASVPGMLFHAVPKLVTWDYAYLDGDLFGLPLAYVKYILLYPLSAGFIFALTIVVINVFMGIARIVT